MADELAIALETLSDDEFSDQEPAWNREGQASDDIVKTHARIRRSRQRVAGTIFYKHGLIAVLIFGWFYFRRYKGGEENTQIYLHERSDIALYQSWVDRPRGQ